MLKYFEKIAMKLSFSTSPRSENLPLIEKSSKNITQPQPPTILCVLLMPRLLFFGGFFGAEPSIKME